MPVDEAFLKEQERRRKKKLGDEFYDVTAGSLPLMYNVEAVAVNDCDPDSEKLWLPFCLRSRTRHHVF